MTEAEWLSGADPTQMVAFVRGRATRRQLALAAVAWCRLIDDLMQHQVSRDAVEWSEWVADGAVLFDDDGGPDDADCFQMGGAANRCLAVSGSASRGDSDEAHLNLSELLEFFRLDEADTPTLKEMAAVCREIFGNPFRPASFAPVWRTDAVMGLAREIHDTRGFSTMPILADALEDAGCTDEALLNHCRGGEPHVHGCWAIDVVLGQV